MFFDLRWFSPDVVENLLYLLWRHLTYYMVHCKPVDPELTLGISGISHTSMRRMQGKHNVTIVTTELEITVGHWPISAKFTLARYPAHAMCNRSRVHVS